MKRTGLSGGQLVHWAPRIGLLAFAAFISLFALDVFDAGYSPLETLLALSLHLIPTFILVAVAILAWRRPWIGAVCCAGWAIWYLSLSWGRFPLSRSLRGGVMNAWLSPSTLRELATALEYERDRIRRSLRALTEAGQKLSVSQAEEGAALGPPADVASDLAEAEFDLGLEETARARLAEVEAALRRIAHHEYGLCERCGDRIGLARLHALPWAANCIACASKPTLRIVR